MRKKWGGVQYSKTLREFYKGKYNVEVGMYSYGGCFSPQFNLGGFIKVGKYCSIAQGVRYYGANHPHDKAVMSPFFYSKSFGFEVKDVPRNSLEIGNDVWIGGNVLITSGCKKIGNGSVIGAGTVVTKDVPAYSIVAGVPAKIIRYRFGMEIMDLLEQSHWFDFEPEWLMKYYELMDEPAKFASKIISERKGCS